ncbi:Hypothetical predicted protein [Paramuricea clavata]|uniref:Reverse transcriptase zinc-binding domain-containing protein n=1 Tax=Paramuricea clavata TaxID=317549 RepID=A0A6S7JJ46_PARCT|nr:Hypothetical predicted protein [Paramuricea clavata]
MGLSSSSECSFCLNPESLLDVVAGCSSYLDRFTWRHDSILNVIANNLPSEHIRTIYADLSSFSNLSTITGDDYRPDLLISTKDNCLYILELTVGYETNLRNDVNRKYFKYKDMIMEQKKNYHAVNSINLSISALGVFDKESSGFIDMLEHFNLDKAHYHESFHIHIQLFMVIRSEQTSEKHFNFTIRYINNTLPTRKNLLKWGLSSTSDCSFCSSPETLLHVIAGCKTYLDEGRFTWRHDSVLNFLASTLTAVKNSTLYVDIPGFMNPSVITGDRLRPDLLLVTENRCLYILELTVGYESNLQVNANRKRQKYRDLINEQKADYDKVKFVNLSLSTLGVFGRSCENFDGMLSSLKCDAKISNTDDVKCYCGKSFKGTRGLKMHQRSCRVIHGLNDELLTDLEQQSTENSTDSFNSSTVEENDAMAHDASN